MLRFTYNLIPTFYQKMSEGGAEDRVKIYQLPRSASGDEPWDKIDYLTLYLFHCNLLLPIYENIS